MDIVGEADSVDQTKSTNYRRWTQSMDSLLLAVLKEQKVKGQKQDKNFTDEAYQATVIAINTEFGLNMKKVNIQNRLKTLKSQMAIAIDLLKQSGFSWNEMTKTIEAEPGVWDGAIKV